MSCCSRIFSVLALRVQLDGLVVVNFGGHCEVCTGMYGSGCLCKSICKRSKSRYQLELLLRSQRRLSLCAE